MATRTEGVPNPSASQWRDRKRYLWLLGLVPPTAVFMATALVWGGNRLGLDSVTPVLWWIGPILVFVLVPALDLVVGPDGENPPDEIVEALENDRFYRYCTYLYLPFQFATLVWACYLWSSEDLSWLGIDGGLGVVSKIGLAISVGVVAGIGINTAHELGHKTVRLERRLSRIALAQSFYGHFYVEHNRGHHVRVSTPEDPASARFGESFWEFLPRSVVGSLRSSWRLERDRLERLGRPVWSLRNEVLSAWLISVVLFAALIAAFGIGIAPYLAIQAVFGFSLLEVVNYLEHYGLLRQRTPSGRYERCTPAHSWNSDHLVTNVFLYHLQRHSDHHANPTRRYQTLRSMEVSPQLPAGYATMLTLAYFPPLWRKVMDHRVLEHYSGDISRINVHPRRREKILARHRATSNADQGRTPDFGEES
ncbi:alkane 1-monooxygenase [Rhodococcus sp. HNM0563]|uniref:alkane 1-monooxygenase n=1 Tax=unclassified Rhodococcus (in: high G+C Gram-positive bacteria) TaxID=192944 RepID=UPI00146CD3C9|nr:MULTISPECIES: alkane 1-monooxygenase [unclassified Rhodococcus (in: high G+C Gram-positive bacteria)]MCK0091109.1 alkane 1-monooxygenase [Rhodococcus sp. F64268]NLU60851.1 alkane 1-monooxygenase [Rhodococcus sp. HNM0563]